MNDVLVLNRNFYAIAITCWQRAVSLLYINHASVVDENYKTYSFCDWKELSEMQSASPSGYLNTPNFKIAMPDVIALKFYDQLPVSEVKFTRRNISSITNISRSAVMLISGIVVSLLPPTNFLTSHLHRVWR